MPITPGERLVRVLDGSQAPGAFSAQLSVPAGDVLCRSNIRSDG